MSSFRKRFRSNRIDEDTLFKDVFIHVLETFKFFQFIFSFSSKSRPLMLFDVIALDYSVNGEFLSKLVENETVSLKFFKNLTDFKRNQMRYLLQYLEK